MVGHVMVSKMQLSDMLRLRVLVAEHNKEGSTVK